MILRHSLIKNLRFIRSFGIFFISITLVSASGCSLVSNRRQEDAIGVETTPPQNTVEMTAEVSNALWTDENPIMSGICFESANDATGQVFAFRNTEELSHLFDLSDNSRLCRRPAQRHTFDFSNGRVLAGLWSKGHGCAADHRLLAFNRDDNARTVDIRLRLVIEGDCDYELVRPFWVGLDNARDYTITIVVE